MTNDKLIQLLITAVPNPKELANFDTSYEGAIRFDYEGRRYRLAKSIFVEEVKEDCLWSNERAYALQTLLKGVNECLHNINLANMIALKS